MLFLVPDSGPASEKPASPEASNDATAGEGTAAPSNVELDLDDAPFLEDIPPDEPEPEPEPEPEKAVAMPAPQPEKKNSFAALLANKKLLFLAGGGTLFLILALVAVNFFLFPSDEKPKEPEKPVAAAPEPRRITVPSTPPEEAAPALPQYITKWEPFIIPMKGPEGEVVLFNLTIAIPTDNPTLNAEIAQRKVVLRDAVYYYLSKRPLDELMSKDKALDLRTDIVRVLNENLTSGKVGSIFVEDYFSEHL